MGRREPAEGPGYLGRATTVALLAGLLASVALAWWDLLALPLVGEDYTIFARVRDGGPANVHVFRPLAGLWTRGLHAVFDAESGVPYHAAVIALHGANALLVFVVGVGLFRNRSAALVAGLAYAVGAVATDSLAWTANVTRPISTFWLLVAACGLVRWGSTAGRAWLAPALLALGLGMQALSNEEAYGTALLAAAWLGLLASGAMRPGMGRSPGGSDELRRGRRGAALALVAVAIAMAAHYLFLQRAPGGAGNILAAGLRQAPASAWERSRDVMAGLGVSFPGSGLLPLALLAPLIVARRVEIALFLLLAFLASFVPFALDAPVEYRSFATLAPNALVIGGAVHGVALLLGDRRAIERGFTVAIALLVLLGAAGPRAERLRRWHMASREIAAVDALVSARDWSPAAPVPALVNLDSTTLSLVGYRLDILELERLTTLDFLDAAGAFVPPAEMPPRPWIGRRLDGSYGEIDPATYFAGRTALPELGLVGAFVEAGGREHARALLADSAIDHATTAVVETDPAALGARAAEGAVEVLAPVVGDLVAGVGSMTVGVQAPEATVLAVRNTFQYWHRMRFSEDQRIYSDVRGTRALRLTARIDGGPPQEAFFLDLYGFGIPVPAGTHQVELTWRRALPEEMR